MEDLGVDFETATLDDLGTAERIVITKDNTTVVGGAGNATDIKARVRQIRTQMEDTSSDYDREKLQERLAKLVGGVAVIYVGAATEIEMKEKKARVEDALNATRAAAEEGIVAGGGVALIRAQAALDALALEGDEAFRCMNIIRTMMEAPLRTIAGNAGEDASIIIHQVRNGNDAFGWNAAENAFGDMFEAGVIDPTEPCCTPKCSLQYNLDLLLTTECMIAEKKEDDE